MSNDASFLEYEGFSFAAKLIVRVLNLPFDRFDGATTLGARGFFSRVTRSFVGHRPTRLRPLAEDTSGEAAF